MAGMTNAPAALCVNAGFAASREGVRTLSSSLPCCWLWIFLTITAAGAQTLRNAMQRDLIETIGAAGATYVLFCSVCPLRSASSCWRWA